MCRVRIAAVSIFFKLVSKWEPHLNISNCNPIHCADFPENLLRYNF